MHFRDAVASDHDSIVAIDQVAQSDPDRVRFIDRVVTSGCCVVATAGRSIVAYGALEYSFFDFGFISMVYVAEPERRRGIGRALVKFLGQRCKTEKLFTSTNESNRGMQSLLKSIGFVPSGVIHNLDPGDPELVFFLDLSAPAA